MPLREPGAVPCLALPCRAAPPCAALPQPAIVCLFLNRHIVKTLMMDMIAYTLFRLYAVGWFCHLFETQSHNFVLHISCKFTLFGELSQNPNKVENAQKLF